MPETSHTENTRYEVELREVPGSAENTPEIQEEDRCQCDTEETFSEEDTVAVVEEPEPYDPHEAMLARYDEANTSAGYLHQGVQNNILWGSIFGALSVVDITGAAISNHTLSHGLGIPIELGLAGYNVAEGIRRSRRAGRHEKLAASIIGQIEQAQAENRALETVRESEAPANQFDLESYGTQRAMVGTFLAEQLHEQLKGALREMGITPPAEQTQPSATPTPPQTQPGTE